MAALQSQTPCPDCDCSDSPLSVTGSVLGILTFAVAVYASLLYYYRGFRASKVEQKDMLYKVTLAEEDLKNVRSRYSTNVHRINDESAKQRLDEAAQRAESCIKEAHDLLIKRSIHTFVSQNYSYLPLAAGWSYTREVTGPRNRAAHVLEREKIVEALGRMEASTRDLREFASDVSGRIPTETDGGLLNMVSVLEEITMQNNGLRLVMEDVLRRVSALENWPRERTTEPRVDEEE